MLILLIILGSIILISGIIVTIILVTKNGGSGSGSSPSPSPSPSPPSPNSKVCKTPNSDPSNWNNGVIGNNACQPTNRSKDQSGDSCPHNGYCKTPTGQCIQYQGTTKLSSDTGTQDAPNCCTEEQGDLYTGSCCHNAFMPPTPSLDLSSQCTPDPTSPVIWDCNTDTCYLNYNKQHVKGSPSPCPKDPASGGGFPSPCGFCPSNGDKCQTIDMNNGSYCIENDPRLVNAFTNSKLVIKQGQGCTPNWNATPP